MSPLSRVARGLSIVADGLEVLLRNPLLLALPAVAALGEMVALAVVGLWLGALVGLAVPVGPVTGLVAAVVAVSLAGLVAGVCDVALVAAATDYFEGYPPSLGGGLRAVRGRLGPTLAWGLVRVSAGPVLALVDRYAPGAVGTHAVLGGATWSARSFFLAPVLLAGAEGLGRAQHQSAGTFRRLWPDRAGAALGVGAAGVVGGTLSVVVVVLGLGSPATALGSVFVAVGLLGLWFVLAASHAGASVMKAALYQYVSGGELPIGFEPVEPERLGYGVRRAGRA